MILRCKNKRFEHGWRGKCTITNLAELAQKTKVSKCTANLFCHSLAKASDCLSNNLVSADVEGMLEGCNAASPREEACTRRAAISRPFRRRNACTDASRARTRNSRLRSKVGDIAPSRLCLLHRKRVTANVEEIAFASKVFRKSGSQWWVCRR